MSCRTISSKLDHDLDIEGGTGSVAPMHKIDKHVDVANPVYELDRTTRSAGNMSN